MPSLYRNRKRIRSKPKLVSDINITPFVDVLLVLLIIFMIAAPMLTSSVDVDLPEGSQKIIDEKDQSIVISVDSQGEVFLLEEKIKLNHLNKKLLELSFNNFAKKIYVRADKNIDYGRVMKVIKTVNDGGFSKVILVTELIENK